jgi:hypothetical protein
MVHPPTYVPFYGTEIRCAEASTNKTSYSVTVLGRPFVGAHVSVGVDEIQFLVGLKGEVTTVNYKHVEDHKLPPLRGFVPLVETTTAMEVFHRCCYFVSF